MPPVILAEIHDPLFRHPIARWGVLMSVAFLALGWIAVLAVPDRPGADVVVHYTTTFGIDALGRWTDLLRLPMVGTMLLVINTTLARVFAARAAVPPHVPADVPSELPLDALLFPVSLLIAATVLLEFAVALGCALLWRVNAGG